jgi:pyruvate dehydrogenase E1 component beta subunit
MSIRDDFPVVFITHRQIQYTEGPVPTGEHLVPFGKADVKRKGSDITIVTYSAMVLKSLEAAETLIKEGIDVEVVDLRTLVPMDVDTVVKSVAKTRRLLIAHEAMKRGGVAGEILWRIQEAAPEVLHDLKAPFRRLAAPNVILPHGATLAKAITPQVEDVVAAVKEVCA